MRTKVLICLFLVACVAKSEEVDFAKEFQRKVFFPELQDDSQAVENVVVKEKGRKKLVKKHVSKIRPVGMLQELRFAEAQSDWGKCLNLIGKVFKKEILIREWLTPMWIRCAQGKESAVQADVEMLLTYTQRLSKEQTGWLQFIAAKKFLQAGKKLSAYDMAFLADQSRSSKDTAALLERISRELGVERSRSDAQIRSGVREEMEEERALIDLQKKGNSIGLVKKIIEMFAEQNNSRLVLKWKDRVPGLIYETTENRERVLSEIERAPGVRIGEWAQAVHRRMDFPLSLRLHRKAFEKTLSNDPSNPFLYLFAFYAARAAHHMSQYEAAEVFYNEAIRRGFGSEEGNEALYRLGLVHFRMKKFKEAVENFDTLLSIGTDKWELNSRYWLVRSLEKIDIPRSELERKWILKQYPLSYYGLRLMLESQSGTLSFEDKNLVEWPRKSWIPMGPQIEHWHKFQILSLNGFTNESATDLQELVQGMEPQLIASLSILAAGRMMYNPAIRLSNQVLEQVPALMSRKTLQLFFPKVQFKLFEEAGQLVGLSPLFLLSLTRQESAFNPRAVSSAAAYGLMQVIPSTASDVAKRLKLNIRIPDELTNPRVSIRLGSSYISSMIDSYGGSIPFALAAYNVGPNKLNSWISARPDVEQLKGRFTSLPEDELWIDEMPWSETNFYVKAILRNSLIYRTLETGKTQPGLVLWQDLLLGKSKD
jgi:soluble lytic murein transglycosylase